MSISPHSLDNPEYVRKMTALDEDWQDCLRGTVEIAQMVYGERGGIAHVMERAEQMLTEYDAYHPVRLSPENAAMLKRRISHNLQKRVWERDKYRCVKCGSHIDLSVDHIIPESKGGTLAFDNLQTMCCSCNARKGNRYDG